ncbi:hypothetical protein [Thermodesulfitimonas sp.]
MKETNPYARLDRFIRAYAAKPGGLVRVLQKAQEIFGYLSPEVQINLCSSASDGTPG